ncbi:PTS sugar transporter subunit IIB [Microbacterium sp. USHLN186]|uniref:PTS sugar transporter subunit IIB n=1 Tax=Microbacterium sp. USHLN186 TaxID=3081286 RepID=UPI003018FB31
MRILVVCGAGASSTFVAQRLERAANGAGLAWSVQAGTERAALDAGGLDLVLVGAHLAPRADGIGTALHGRTPVLVLPADAPADLDGSRTLRFVRDAIAAPHDRKEHP